ncbi:MAG: hypothetical protein JNJ50_16120 [Acidobacteria bacterium]|nr:hypothetical protein [Acidobacteriota bacterium]
MRKMSKGYSVVIAILYGIGIADGIGIAAFSFCVLLRGKLNATGLVKWWLLVNGWVLALSYAIVLLFTYIVWPLQNPRIKDRLQKRNQGSS